VLRYFADTDLDRIALAYLSGPDENRKQILRTSYREITGNDLEARVQIIQD
jgi:hypothetical protein